MTPGMIQLTNPTADGLGTMNIQPLIATNIADSEYPMKPGNFFITASSSYLMNQSRRKTNRNVTELSSLRSQLE